ncbi:DUF2062 domain-containing protein [Oceanicella actignis]|uniref:DUF2062 domain-containing protein n=1 Tax=Oceanicella actignis TaxID=1189325 RepID=UPI0011E70A91|nr:DUF2062 domain-containing protein [Oceanicella actignis]TYO91618.1 hypothetical protein LY05_00475 [Oceanicella actignis]
MIFKRRDKAPVLVRLRELLVPRKGWRRGYLYIGKRMQRLPDTPHRIALGFACGVFVSFTPFFGLHFVLAAALAWLLGGNILASALGTFVGNPATFPFIAGAALYIGFHLTGVHVPPPQDFSLGWLWANLESILVPYLLGGLGPGLICAWGFYALVRPIVAAYQSRRRERLMAAARRRVHEHANRLRARKARRRDGDGKAADDAA